MFDNFDDLIIFGPPNERVPIPNSMVNIRPPFSVIDFQPKRYTGPKKFISIEGDHCVVVSDIDGNPAVTFVSRERYEVS